MFFYGTPCSSSTIAQFGGDNANQASNSLRFFFSTVVITLNFDPDLDLDLSTVDSQICLN